MKRQNATILAASLFGLAAVCGLATAQHHRPAQHPGHQGPVHHMQLPAHIPAHRPALPQHPGHVALPHAVRPVHLPAPSPATRRPAVSGVRPIASQRPQRAALRPANGQRPSLASVKPTPSQRPRQSARPVASNRPATSSLRLLPASTNQTLIGAESKVGPLTQGALKTSLSGGLLSDQQVSLLRGAIEKNPKLSKNERAAIASALQADADEKRRLARADGPNPGSTFGPGGPAFPTNPGYPASPTDPGYPGFPTGPVVPAVATAPTPLPSEPEPEPFAPAATEDAQPQDDEHGMKITSVFSGSAAEDDGLREGDVILSIGGVRTQSVADFQAAVGRMGSEVEVVFVNGENGRVESLMVRPRGGRLGVECEVTPVN